MHQAACLDRHAWVNWIVITDKYIQYIHHLLWLWCLGGLLHIYLHFLLNCVDKHIYASHLEMWWMGIHSISISVSFLIILTNKCITFGGGVWEGLLCIHILNCVHKCMYLLLGWWCFEWSIPNPFLSELCSQATICITFEWWCLGSFTTYPLASPSELCWQDKCITQLWGCWLLGRSTAFPYRFVSELCRQIYALPLGRIQCIIF